MQPFAYFLETIGTAGLQAFWLPCLLWTLLFLPCYLALKVWKKAHPFIQYYVRLALLLTLPLGLLAAWTTSLPLTWWPQADTSTSGPSLLEGSVMVEGLFPLELLPAASGVTSAISVVAGVLLLLAVLIALFHLSRLCLDAYQLKYFRRSLVSTRDPRLQEAIDETARQLRLTRLIRGFSTPPPLIPLTFGWLRPHIVVPDDLLDDRQGLRLTVAHELTHIRRHDVLLHIVERVLQALFFFHPGVHLLCRSLADYRELSCDAEVLAQPGVDGKGYARLLYRFSQVQPVQPRFALSMAAAPRHLKQRILAMKHYSPTTMKTRSPRFIALTLAALLFSAGTLFVACSDPVDSNQPNLDENVATADNLAGKDIFMVVEQMPELQGGLKALQAKINYPKAAKEAGVEGRVIVQFVVDEQGAVVDPLVVKGVDQDLDREALRVVREMRFEPGMQRGKTVAVKLSLPITFKLGNAETKIEKRPELLGGMKDIFTVVEQMPELQGGLKALQAKINYPKAAKEAGVEGRVIVQFVIDEEGRVFAPEVVAGIDPALDEEALRVVGALRFEPGMQDGKAVKVKMKLPITFSLGDA